MKSETMTLMEKRTALEAQMNSIIDRLCQPGGPGLSDNLVDSEVFFLFLIYMPFFQLLGFRFSASFLFPAFVSLGLLDFIIFGFCAICLVAEKIEENPGKPIHMSYMFVCIFINKGNKIKAQKLTAFFFFFFFNIKFS